MKVDCHYCGKKTDYLLELKCKHCEQCFCINHYLPENHKCPKFKTEKWADKKSKEDIVRVKTGLCYDCGKILEPSNKKKEYWFDRGLDEVITICKNCWDLRRKKRKT